MLTVANLRISSMTQPWYTQVLHHPDPVPPPDNERGTCRTGRHWQDGVGEGPGQGPGDHGLRLQLLGADGLQSEWITHHNT